ncbi:MAG: hypothetical protein IJ301_01480 [Clostridia bacterium]|nr:hypothetical protein [Clostridia bacterium]
MELESSIIGELKKTSVERLEILLTDEDYLDYSILDELSKDVLIELLKKAVSRISSDFYDCGLNVFDQQEVDSMELHCLLNLLHKDIQDGLYRLTS